VTLEQRDQRRRDRLFAFAVALLAQPDGRSCRVEVAAAQVQGAFAAGAGLQVEPHDEQVEVGVAAGGADGVDQLGQLVVVEGPASAAGPSRLGQRGGGVDADEPGVGCGPVEAWSARRRG